MIRKMREKQIAAQDAHKRIEGAQHAARRLVKAQQKNDAIDTELAHQRRREAMREEHYRKQEEDARGATQENRLLSSASSCWARPSTSTRRSSRSSMPSRRRCRREHGLAGAG